MGFLQNQNTSLGFSQPEVTHWESTPHLSSDVNNTIIVLGVLTFALQLCLVLFVMLRCWRLDNRVRQALKSPNNLSAVSTFHPDMYKQVSYQLSKSAGADESITGSQYATSIPWDLVQN